MKTILTTASLLLLLTSVNAQKAGTLDTSFNKTGILTDTTFVGATSMVLQTDGKILLGGTITTGSGSAEKYYYGSTRYNSNGTIDNTFGANGVNKQLETDDAGFGISCEAFSLCVLPNGKIIQGGDNYSGGNTGNYDPFMGRYNANGSFSKKVDFGAIQSTNVAQYFSILKPQSDNSILVLNKYYSTYQAGATNNPIRLDTALKIDHTFNLPKTISGITDFTIQTDGSIIVAGYGFNLVRYRADLTIDVTFGTSGVVTTSIGNTPVSIALQADGKIILVGTSSNSKGNTDITLVRFNKDGSLDNSFGTNGRTNLDFSTANDVGYRLVIQPNGNIIVLGSTDFNGHGNQPVLVRYNKYGVIDTTFGKVIITNTAIASNASLILQNDNKILVSSNTFVARYNADTTSKATTGIKTEENINNISVYPNPSNGQITLNINSNATKSAQLEVVNMLGQVIDRRSLNLVEGVNTVCLSINVKGIYVVQIATDKEVIKNKIIVE